MEFREGSDVNDFAKFIFNTALNDTKEVLGKIGGTFPDEKIMKLLDTFSCVYYFLFVIETLNKYGSQSKPLLDQTLLDICSLLVNPSGELATGSNFPNDYARESKDWFSEDPLQSPIIYLNEVVNKEFDRKDGIELILEPVSRIRKRISEAFQVD